MTPDQQKRASAPVGRVTDLDAIEAASVRYLRLWSERSGALAEDFTSGAGADCGPRALEAFDQLCRLCAQHGRRPLMRHAVDCQCLGADEACFATFIATAAQGAREDAMLIAILLVRVDVAPLIVSCAADFGLALKRSQGRSWANPNPPNPILH